jgi:FkbM family methyltransferase
MKYLALFIFKFLFYFDKVIYLLFKKNYIYFFSDIVNQNLNVKKKIHNKTINFFAPNLIIKWRIDTIFSKEPGTIKWIDEFNREKNIFWDIGANIGLYSIYAAIKHKNIEVTSFEPSTSNLRVLSRNISLNNLSQNIKIFQPALSKEENSFMMFNEHKFIEGWSMNQFSNEYNGDTSKDFEQNYKIYGTNIDSLIAQNVLQIPNYIKLDVDGIEHLILQGGEKTLKNSNLKSILVEIDESLKDQLSAIMNIMKNNNFTIKEKENVLINQKSKKFNNQFNYIFERN